MHSADETVVISLSDTEKETVYANLDKLTAHLDSLGISESSASELRAHIDAIRSELSSPEQQVAVVQMRLESLMAAVREVNAWEDEFVEVTSTGNNVFSWLAAFTRALGL